MIRFGSIWPGRLAKGRGVIRKRPRMQIGPSTLTLRPLNTCRQWLRARNWCNCLNITVPVPRTRVVWNLYSLLLLLVLTRAHFLVKQRLSVVMNAPPPPTNLLSKSLLLWRVLES